MKTRSALIVILSLALSGAGVRAQDQDPVPAPTPNEASVPLPTVLEESPQVAQAAPAPAPAGAFAAPAPAPAPVEPASPAAGPATAPSEELLPLIMFEDAPLNDAIKTLARQAGLNFQFDPKVAAPPPGPDGQPAPQPTVSIRFENITAQQALEAVLANHSLQMILDPKTKTYRITTKDPAAPDPLVTRIVQLKYADPTNMVAIIKPSLSNRSSAVADVRTSQIILTATEREMLAVDTLVETLDKPTRQVLIEARILETAKNPNSIRGIDWSGTLKAQNFSFGNNTRIVDPALSVNRLVTGEGIPRLLLDTAKGFNPATAFLDADGVSAVLSFLNTDNETEVISTPRAVTQDNEKATLSVTRAFPIFQITPGSANSPAGSQVTYTNLGTILEVTPRISANDTIALTVVPEVSNREGQDSQTVGGLLNVANIYSIRRIQTRVLIPSGHTLVMGGLISDNKTHQRTKVPLLGDIPGLGRAFRSDDKLREKKNLLIFVTPTIVQDEDFHPTPTDFLQHRVAERPEPEESFWDSAKPHDGVKRR